MFHVTETLWHDHFQLFQCALILYIISDLLSLMSSACLYLNLVGSIKYNSARRVSPNTLPVRVYYHEVKAASCRLWFVIYLYLKPNLHWTLGIRLDPLPSLIVNCSYSFFIFYFSLFHLFVQLLSVKSRQVEYECLRCWNIPCLGCSL